MTSYPITRADLAGRPLILAADAGGHHINVQLADGGTLRVGQRGLDDGVRISHARPAPSGSTTPSPPSS